MILDKNCSLDNHDKINNLLRDIQKIKFNTKLVNLAIMYGGALEPLLVPFLILEGSYYRIIGELQKNKDELLELYYEVGKVEAYISVGIYKETLQGDYCKPNFIDEIKINIKNGIHPLINNPVKNSILADKKGVVLTGTNMSGKSTFLRMLGINVIFAQTVYFTLTAHYECCLLNVVSSISPKDDVNVGKSYYMAEAEAILRILGLLNKEIPVLSIIDEIFRGTNPVERIASSAAILNYINKSNSITFVATHDKELTDLLKDNYDFYYFSENVDDNGLSFDYKLKEGLVKSRNAIKLLDYIGYPEEIINEANLFAKKVLVSKDEAS